MGRSAIRSFPASVAPSRKFAAVSLAGGDVDFDDETRGIYVGTGGDLTVKMALGGGSVTFPNVQDGTVLPLAVTGVVVATTTASDLVVLY